MMVAVGLPTTILGNLWDERAQRLLGRCEVLYDALMIGPEWKQTEREKGREELSASWEAPQGTCLWRDACLEDDSTGEELNAWTRHSSHRLGLQIKSFKNTQQRKHSLVLSMIKITMLCMYFLNCWSRLENQKPDGTKTASTAVQPVLENDILLKKQLLSQTHYQQYQNLWQPTSM